MEISGNYDSQTFSLQNNTFIVFVDGNYSERAAVLKKEKQTRISLVLLGFNFMFFQGTQLEHSSTCKVKLDIILLFLL